MALVAAKGVGAAAARPHPGAGAAAAAGAGGNAAADERVAAVAAQARQEACACLICRPDKHVTLFRQFPPINGAIGQFAQTRLPDHISLLVLSYIMHPAFAVRHAALIAQPHSQNGFSAGRSRKQSHGKCNKPFCTFH